MEIGAVGGLGWAPATQGAAVQNAAASGAPAMAATPAASAILGPAPSAAQGADGESAAIAADRAIADLMNATGPRKVDMECQTCNNRRYQDGSDDPGVSFKMPTHIDPAVSAGAVLGHEREHVMRNQAKAASEGDKVVSQSVILHGDTCPECGRFYIAGGTTYTTTKSGGEKGGPATNNPAAGNASTGGAGIEGLLNAMA